MSAVQDMLEPNPEDRGNLNRMVHSQHHRFHAALANYIQYDVDPRTELSIPVGPRMSDSNLHSEAEDLRDDQREEWCEKIFLHHSSF